LIFMAPPLSLGAAKGVQHLVASDPVLAEVIARVGLCDIEPVEPVDLFHALLPAIVYQQLHGKAAAAIHGRVLALFPDGRGGAAVLQAVPDDLLRGAGLSANKLLAARDLAAKTLDGTVPRAAQVAQLSDDELIERLTAIRGIGPWTVHMLMIFHLGRPDVMPTGDFAIRKAFSLLYRCGRAVTAESLLRHARRWQPHRSVASWYLWRSLDTPWPSENPGR
jgi:3-methyladenine DNA glycosylase/8-oxoguanine DNA glycosylase